MYYLIQSKDTGKSDCHLYELLFEDDEYYKVKDLNSAFKHQHYLHKNNVVLTLASEFHYHESGYSDSLNFEYLKEIKLTLNNTYKDSSYIDNPLKVINENEDFIQVEYKSFVLGYYYPILLKSNYDIEVLEVYYSDNEQDNYLDSYDFDR